MLCVVTGDDIIVAFVVAKGTGAARETETPLRKTI